MWHENLPAFEFFLTIQSYWQIGFSGVTGLDHAAVIAKITLYKESRKAQRELLADVEALEQGCLQAWRDKQAEDKANEKDSKHPLSIQQQKDIQSRRDRRC